MFRATTQYLCLLVMVLPVFSMAQPAAPGNVAFLIHLKIVPSAVLVFALVLSGVVLLSFYIFRPKLIGSTSVRPERAPK